MSDRQKDHHIIECTAVTTGEAPLFTMHSSWKQHLDVRTRAHGDNSPKSNPPRSGLREGRN